MKRHSKAKFFGVSVAIVLIAVLAITGISIGGTEYVKDAFAIRRGIDIQGGVSAKLQPVIENSEGQDLSQDLDALKKMIEDRLDRQNILDRMVSVDKSNGRVIVEFPWTSDGKVEDPQEFVMDAIKTAKLTFQEAVFATTEEKTAYEKLQGDTSSLTKKEINGYKKTVGDSQFAYDLQGENLYKLVGDVLLEGKDVKEAAYQNNVQATSEDDRVQVSLEFTDEGSELFGDATETCYTNNSQLGILMDNEIISAPSCTNGRIDGGSAVISGGGMSVEEATELAARINAGSLPFDVNIVDINVISSRLGNHAYNIMMWSLLIAMILIMLYMIVLYRLPGVVASLALLAHIAITLLFISNFGITITLPGLAGIILTIGMAVDANVIIFERLKEEINLGKSLHAAVDSAFKRAFTAIFDGNITTLIVGAVLYYFGTGAIKSFAITLMLGVALSFITAVTATRLMLQGISQFSVAKYPALYSKKMKKDVKGDA